MLTMRSGAGRGRIGGQRGQAEESGESECDWAHHGCLLFFSMPLYRTRDGARVNETLPKYSRV